MTTSRKPPLSPKPRLTRAPAKQQPEPRNPITTEIMQRVRRVIVNSRGLITSTSIADELGFNRRQFAEWLACWRALPCQDNLLQIIRWLTHHDATMISDIFYAITPKFRGKVSLTMALSEKDVANIRASEEPIAVLARRYHLHETMISKIRNGYRHWLWIARAADHAA